MPDETTYEWFHKDRKFFFLKKDGEITHCYQLSREHCSDVDKNRWWQIVPIIMDDLVPVPRDSEIEYQLHSLDDKRHPSAGVFTKNIRERHPRRHQWGQLESFGRFIPKRWRVNPMTVPDDRDFVSAPFLAD